MSAREFLKLACLVGTAFVFGDMVGTKRANDHYEDIYELIRELEAVNGPLRLPDHVPPARCLLQDALKLPLPADVMDSLRPPVRGPLPSNR